MTATAWVDPELLTLHKGLPRYHLGSLERTDGGIIPVADSYEVAASIFYSGWIGTILCVDVPRALYVRSCADAHEFFYSAK